MPNNIDWRGVGAAIGALLLGLYVALRRPIGAVLNRRFRRKPPLQEEAKGEKLRSPVSVERKLRCYEAYVKGQKNRLVTHYTLRVLSNARDDKPLGLRAIHSSVKALVRKKIANLSEDAVCEALNDLVDGGLVFFSAGSCYGILHLGSVLCFDYDSWRDTHTLCSAEKDRLACLDGIVKYVEKSSLMGYILKSLEDADEPMSAQQVHQAIMSMPHDKDVPQVAVEKTLEKMSDDPFVVASPNGYNIHENGRTLLHCIAERKLLRAKVA